MRHNICCVVKDSTYKEYDFALSALHLQHPTLPRLSKICRKKSRIYNIKYFC